MEGITGSIIIGCWIFFIVYWIVSSLAGKRVLERQSISAALAHRLPVGLGWFLLVFPRFQPPLNHRVIPHTGEVMAVGAAVCVAGLLITIWARWTLAGNWSSDVTFKEGHELIRSGPYRFVRHPIYTGLLIMGMGAAIDMGRAHCWLGLLVAYAGFWIKLSQEERLLLRHFPREYPQYQREVKALIPGII